LVLTPDSGPCDATIQATGSGFPPDSAITFSLNRPYSEGYFASIGSTVSDASGAFSAEVTLSEVGCTVASRDEQFDSPGDPKEFGLTASVDAAPAVGRSTQYTYTTVSVGGSAPTAAAESPSGASGSSTPVIESTSTASVSTPSMEDDTDAGGHDDDDDRSWLWVTVGAAILALLGLGVFAIIRVRDRTEG
jgi:hypothetical protein